MDCPPYFPDLVLTAATRNKVGRQCTYNHYCHRNVPVSPLYYWPIELFVVVMYLGLHVKCPIVCLIWNKLGVSRQIFVRVFGIKLQENPSSGSRADTSGQTDGQTWLSSSRLTRTRLKMLRMCQAGIWPSNSDIFWFPAQTYRGKW